MDYIYDNPYQHPNALASFYHQYQNQNQQPTYFNQQLSPPASLYDPTKSSQSSSSSSNSDYSNFQPYLTNSSLNNSPYYSNPISSAYYQPTQIMGNGNIIGNPQFNSSPMVKAVNDNGNKVKISEKCTGKRTDLFITPSLMSIEGKF